ncbi:MAG: radical SAM protein [bacterium]|nr:radical SAM protein [bacterium]
MAPGAPRWLRRRLVPVHQGLERRVHELCYLFFEITQRCNLTCRHCGSDCTRDAAQPDLPADDVLRVLGQVRERHDPAGITVALTGGEPLLYPDFWNLARAITDLGFPWGMVTNGWAWDEDTVDQARRAGMRTVTVSHDGPARVHDWLRGRAGSHDRACRALRMLARAPWLEALDVVTCVHPRNLAHLDATRLELTALGVPRMRVATISPIGRAAGDRELVLSPGEFRGLMAWIESRRGTGGTQVTFSEAGYVGACDTSVRDHPFFCRAGVNVAGIMADGSIGACPNIDRRITEGNIADQDFCRVWENGYRRFRDRRWMRTGDCTACDEWRNCQGHAMHLWDPETGRTRVCYHHECGLHDRPVDPAPQTLSVRQAGGRSAPAARPGSKASSQR